MYDHIILISVDTLRSDGIACNPFRLWSHEYGLSYNLQTPLLDELVRNGAFFANTITVAPYTSASHASLVTGLWPPNHGAYEFLGKPLSVPTIFTAAKEQGYCTILKTDFPVMLGRHLGFDRDVDQYFVEDDDSVVDVISQVDRSCSLIHFGSVHIPYGFHSLRFGGAGYVDKVEALEAEIGHLSDRGPADVLSETYRSTEDLELLLRYKRIIVELYANRQYDRLFKLYLEGIEHFCQTRFERFLSRLSDATAKSRALFVLFGDHGEAYNDETYGHFNSIDEGVLRVPLLFWGHEIKPGLFRSRVRTIDLVPTLYDLLGWKVTASPDGTSLTGAMRDGELIEPRRAHSQAFVAQAQQAFRAQRQFCSGDEMEQVRHVLYKEAIYDGPYKLSRRRYVAGTENRVPIPCLPELRLEQFDTDLRLHSISNDRLAASLETGMNNYGLSSPTSSVAVPAELRRHLQNHGYLQSHDTSPET
jgi:choline-sulfatase